MTSFKAHGWTILFYTEFEDEEPPPEDDLEEHDVADLFAVLQEDDNSSE
jgi:hypothetical protein